MKSGRHIGLLIILFMLIVLAGFYPTYFSKFPTFAGFTNAHHFHGVMMVSWFSLLIVQPFLIQNKRFALHRTFGKISYVILPILLYSIYLVTLKEYYKDLPHTSEEDLAGDDVALNLLNLISFGTCYLLAIINRHKTTYHSRYMISTAILMLAPGTIRAILVYGIISEANYSAVIYSAYGFSIAICLGLILIDRIKGYPYKPYIVVAGMMVTLCVVYFFRGSTWWLWTSRKIVEWIF
jgi:hypothetical protein